MGNKISGWLKATAASVVLVAVMASGGQGSLVAASRSAATRGDHAPACGTPAVGHASCGAIELLNPSQNWHPGPNAAAPLKRSNGGTTTTTTAPSGYYPADLQSAYNLAGALNSMTKPGGATIVVVDAYNDPYAATDLATYRSTMSAATDPSTKLTGTFIPPLCSSTVTSNCVHFTQVNQSGGTRLPKGNTGWGEEISLDLDMISAICPDCNITLVEASSSSFSNLDAAVAYAKSLHPAAVTNSYGGSEFSSETSYNSDYSYSSSGGQTAVTAATGDSGYGVEFPAAAPNLTAVGGTSLTYTGTGSSLVWNQTVWSGAGAGCSTYEAMPTWQATTAFYLSSVCANRQVGDVSAVADPNTGVAVYDTYGEPGWMVFGGTSVSTQIIGAMYGLAAGAGVEQPSPAGLYQGTGVVAVTSGSDGSCGSTYLCQAGTGQLSSGYAGPVGVGVPDGIGAFSVATAGSLSFSPSSETATAGQPIGPLTVSLSASAPSGGVTINLATSSSGGGFSTSSTGTLSHTLSLTIAGGDTATQPFYYEDTVAGAPTVTASATGWTTGNLSVTVDPGPLASITVSPSSATVAEGATQTFTATGTDSYGNPVVVDPSWTTTVSGGAVSPSSGSSTTFTAGSTSGSGIVTATEGSVSDSASVSVSSLANMTVSVTNGSTVRKGPNYHTPVTVTVANATTLTPLGGANVALDIFSGSCSTGTLVSSGSGTTGSNGQVTFTFTTKSQGTYCALATATYSGYSTGTSQDTFTN